MFGDTFSPDVNANSTNTDWETKRWKSSSDRHSETANGLMSRIPPVQRGLLMNSSCFAVSPEGLHP
jgi:hypothetical protein